MRRAIAIAAGLLVLLALGVVVVSGRMADLGREPLGATPGDVGLAYDTVSFPARDLSLALRAWWIPVADAKAAVLLVHGGGSNRSLRFPHGMELARDLVVHRYAVLALDLRNHGESDASPDGALTFGDAESYDVLGAVDYLAARDPGLRFAVVGFSMGGMTAIYAAAREPRLEAVVTNGAPASARDVMPHYASAVSGLPPWLTLPFTWASEYVHGVPFGRGRPETVIARIAPRPVLVVQNEGDPIVRVEQGRRLAAAGPSAELWLVPAPAADHPLWAESGPWGMHVRSYAQDPEAYLARVVGFLDRVFAAPARAAGA